MGTRSTIALEFADGTVEQVYCHWDGYLSHNGRILQSEYMDPFKVKQLLALGGFSSLKATVGETAESAYTQRGEEISIDRYKNMVDYWRNSQQEEYNYCLRCINGVAVWYVNFYESAGRWVTLEEAFLMTEECEE